MDVCTVTHTAACRMPRRHGRMSYAWTARLHVVCLDGTAARSIRHTLRQAAVLPVGDGLFFLSIHMLNLFIYACLCTCLYTCVHTCLCTCLCTCLYTCLYTSRPGGFLRDSGSVTMRSFHSRLAWIYIRIADGMPIARVETCRYSK